MAALLLGSFGVACSKSDKSGMGGPQKAVFPTAHKRLYFSYNNCDLSTMKYLGWNKAEAFETLPPETLNPDIAWRYIEVQFTAGPNQIYKTLVLNPFFEAMSESSTFAIYRCKATFFIDVPKEVDLGLVNIVNMNLIAFEDKLSLPLQINVTEASSLAESDVVTAEKALANTPHRVMRFFGDAPSDKAWDLVILGDGYTAEELQLESEEGLRTSKLGQQVQKIVDELFLYKPFDEVKTAINIWLVAAPSKESGADIPQKKIVKDTFYEASLGANCVGRAPTVKRGLLALEMASKVPFDQVLVLMNTREHGGSGGTFAISTSSDGYIDTVLHELGHSVGRLADFYYYFSDQVTFGEACPDIVHEEFVVSLESTPGGNSYSSDDSKIAPNLTNFVDTHAKWAQLLTVNVAPVYMAYPKKTPEVINKTQVKFTTRFTPDFQKIVFSPSIYPGANQALLGFQTISIDGVNITPDKITIETKPAKTYGGSGPVEAEDLTFMVIDAPIVTDRDVEVVIQYGEQYKDWVPWVVSDSASFKFVSYVFEPTEIGLFQGANPSLNRVFRSSYTSMMMISGLPFDIVEEQAMRNAIQQFAAPPEVPTPLQ